MAGMAPVLASAELSDKECNKSENQCLITRKMFSILTKGIWLITIGFIIYDKNHSHEDVMEGHHLVIDTTIFIY
jgi:hypothetical protein